MNSVFTKMERVTFAIAAVLLTSTGYNDGRRAEFVVEFTSTEPISAVPLEQLRRYRLASGFCAGATDIIEFISPQTHHPRLIF